MYVAASLPDFEFEILPCLRKRVIKLEPLVRDRPSILDFYLYDLIPQIEHVDAVHIALPNELRTILSAEDPRKQYQYVESHRTSIVTGAELRRAFFGCM